jgi:hypothetical protein
MMLLNRINLNAKDHFQFRAIVAFLNGRLEERASINWALKLRPDDNVKRLALLFIINKDGENIKEPWRSAWHLIEESLSNPEHHDNDLSGAYIHMRLKAGDRSGSIASAIVNSVAPRLKVEAFSDLHRYYQKLSIHPKKVAELFSVSVTSGKLIDHSLLTEIQNVKEPSFFVTLAIFLNASITQGFDIAKRLGWLDNSKLWKLGEVRRVYYITPSGSEEEHEPDKYNSGIAPSVKLLHTVLARLVDIDISNALELICYWKYSKISVYLRLWAAFSRDYRITSPDDVAEWLLSLDDSVFWKLDEYPEIAELRAKRFNEFTADDQSKLISRIVTLPPRSHWAKKANVKEVRKRRYYYAVQELLRIEIVGVSLPKRGKKWLDEHIVEFPELQNMSSIDYEFPQGVLVRHRSSNPDSRFDFLSGLERLKSLEESLSSARRGWDDNPSERASDWVSAPGNSLKILRDFESLSLSDFAFPKVLDSFCRVHFPNNGTDAIVANGNLQTCNRVLSLLITLSTPILYKLIQGITSWLSFWSQQVANSSEGLSFCLKLWPIAVEITNAEQPAGKNVFFETNYASSEELTWGKDETQHNPPDTLSTSAGQLVGVFLATCPNLSKSPRPFDTPGVLRTMRDTLINTDGRSGLIARLRMIEWLPYFLEADSEWTNEHFIKPLDADDQEAIFLWQAVAGQTRFQPVLEIIGDSMMKRISDARIDRVYRQSFIFSLVIESLRAFLEDRNPVVQIQKMIRSLDDEDRAYAADAIQIFVRDVTHSSKNVNILLSHDHVFRYAAKPFLKEVWPQEQSLSTSGVSRALANLPATAKQAFVEAVDVIERFLLQFDCWSLSDYGLFESQLLIIDDEEKAEACLRLLDHTIGTNEKAVVPFDLSDALDHSCRIAPKLQKDARFRRLETLARRR